MKEYYRIGQVSSMYHIEISKLRYYDQINLFKPMKVDPKSGYRTYHVSQFPILSEILMFRDLGISIDQIKARIFNTNPSEILAFIDEAEVKLQMQLEKIKKKKDLLHAIQADVRKAVERKNNYQCMMSPDFIILAHEYETDQESGIEELIQLSEKARETDPGQYASASYFEMLSHEDFLSGKKKRRIKGICAERVQEMEWPYSKINGRFCLHCFIESPDPHGHGVYQDLLNYIKDHHLQVIADILQIQVMHYERKQEHISVLELYIPVKEMSEMLLTLE